jgi:adenylosuccinate synthase
MQILQDLHYTDFDITEEERLWMEGIEYMRQFQLTDTEIELGKALAEGKSVLAEGAQGTMLDIDHGTYPFVSSSNTVSGGVCTGLGVAPNSIGEVFGIFKAYSTRVGSGPFPVELFDETGDKIREIGHEYGAVTGRNRRCGWLDLVALKYAIMINGVTQLIMMKSDVLDTFDTIRVCVAYQKDGVTTTDMPYDTEGWQAVYEDLPGWKTDLTQMTSEAQFPQQLKDYITYIEKATGTPITIVSVGPDRAQTIER